MPEFCRPECEVFKCEDDGAFVDFSFQDFDEMIGSLNKDSHAFAKPFLVILKPASYDSQLWFMFEVVTDVIDLNKICC